VNTLRIRRPDDWHLHLRDGAALQAVVAHTARQFGRAIVMPNLKPPVTTTAAALAYRQRILAALPAGSGFTPLMTLYLTDNTDPAEIATARASGAVAGCKLYPAGATTNSDSGVTDIRKLDAVLEQMAQHRVPLLVHAEVTHSSVDVFDREKRFIDDILVPLHARLPQLRIVVEHATTRAAVEFVRSAAHGLAATLTPQHLLMNRNELFSGGMRPHHYCLPVLKREADRVALLSAATSGDERFFLGTDSAPHARSTKEAACGCAGIYSAHAAIEFYAEAFDSVDALDKLQGFASEHGPRFYGLPVNDQYITLQRHNWTVPDHYPFVGGDPLVPLRAGGTLAWQLQDADTT